jgi:PAS domain S-box-containing protein
MKTFKRTWLLDLLLSAAAVAGAFVCSILLWNFIRPLATLLFFPAVILVSWKRGLRAGVFAIALSAAAIAYFVPAPAGPTSEPVLSRLMFFIIAALAAVGFTQMHRTQRLRQKQEESFRVTLASIGDAVISTDAGGRVRFMNATAEQLTGYSGDEAAGKDIAEILPLSSEETGEKIPSPVRYVLTKSEAIRIGDRAVVTARDGSRRSIEDSAAPIYDSNGQLTGAVLVFHDVTERQLADRRLRAQQETSRILAEAATLAEAAPQILQVLCETLRWDIGNVWRVDVDAQLLRWVDSRHLLGDQAKPFVDVTQEMVFTKGVGLPGRAWQQMNVAWIEDVTVDPNFPRGPYAAASGLVSGFAFPILIRDEVFGVIEFFSRERRPRDDDFLRIMAAIGSQLGQFIQRKSSQQALHQSEQRQRAILSAALDCIISMDHEGKVVEWNRAAERVFGYNREDVIGKPLANLIIPPDLREQHWRGLAHYLRTGEGPVIGRRIEMRAIRADGAEFPVELAITRITEMDPPLFTGFIRDITERKSFEEELQRQKNAAEAASRAKDQFFAMLSHELRTPLTPVLAGIDMLENPTTEFNDVKETLQIMRRNILVERRLIDDLLDVTRIIRGRLELNLESVDAHRVVSHVLDICRSELETKRLHLVQDLKARNHFVHADPARLQQILWNLLKNAIRYTPEGGEIVLRSSNNGHAAFILSVEDNGMGIPAELLRSIFDPFEQGITAQGSERGIGLGLAIAKGLAAAHRGSLQAFSEGPGKGARFMLELQTAAEPAETSNVPSAEAMHTRGLRILLVDDHLDTRQSLHRLLERRGYHVQSAGDLQSALKLVEHGTFDLLISDIALPDGNGTELMRILRQKSDVRGIALSGFGMEADVNMSREAGFAEHLVKPVAFETLERVIQRLEQAATQTPV